MVNKSKEIVVDELVVEYNEKYKQNTESHVKDSVYNWLIDKYSARGKKFVFWDRLVWKGSVYMIPEFVGYIVFFAVFYFLGSLILARSGWEKMVMFFFLLMIWRVNMLVGLLKKINTKVGEM